MLKRVSAVGGNSVYKFGFGNGHKVPTLVRFSNGEARGKGRYLPGLFVTEMNNFSESEPAITNVQNQLNTVTNSNGAIGDIVTANGTLSQTPLTQAEMRSDMINQRDNTSHMVTTQTLIIAAPGYGHIATAVYERTFTNKEGSPRPGSEASKQGYKFTVSVSPVTVTYPTRGTP